MHVFVDIYASERRVYRNGVVVSKALEASFRPIAADDFLSFDGKHVVDAAPLPRYRVAAPPGSVPEPGPESYRYVIRMFGGESAMTAGYLLRVAELGLYGCSLVPIPCVGVPRATSSSAPHPSLFATKDGDS